MGLPIAWPVNPVRLSTYRMDWRTYYCFVVHEINLFSLLWFTHSSMTKKKKQKKKRIRTNEIKFIYTRNNYDFFVVFFVRLLPPQPTRLCCIRVYCCITIRIVSDYCKRSGKSRHRALKIIIRFRIEKIVTFYFFQLKQ